MSKLYDVAVVGAGPGGSAAAHYLAQSGLDVLLLDKAEFPRDKTCGDGLTPRAIAVLEDMGVMDELNTVGWRIHGLELHAAGGNVMTASIPKQDGYPNYLMITPRLTLDDVIRRRAVASGAQFHSRVKVRDVAREDGQVVVRGDHLGRSASYRARVAVLSMGANMRMLRRMGILTYRPRLILAARAYYEGMDGLSDRVQAHFENVPLPGYGWVFPLSENAANVGVGFWPSKWPWFQQPSSARVAMDSFLQNGKLKAMMNGAKATSEIKSYPLRIDFASAATYGERVLLVGEAAGLVSPLTGEGIDFALESGKLAAEFLGETLKGGDLSRQRLAGYDKLLRSRFQRLFVFLGRVRQLYINPFLMTRAVRAANRFPALKETLVNVMMGHQEAAEMVNFNTIRKVILGA